MERTYLVTGSASGIGKATKELLEERGNRVIGVDIAGADIAVDLSTAEGREQLVVEATRLSGGTIDGVLSIAGLLAPTPATVSVNYFGMIAVLEGMLPLLSTSNYPRAAGVSSRSSLDNFDSALVDAMRDGDESAARARATELAEQSGGLGGGLIYASTKRAFAQWVRREAPTDRWAGAHIPLNAIAPSIVVTAMSAPEMATEEARSLMRERRPMPLNGFAEPIAPARLLAWLTSVENSHVCGQVIFIDGGADALMRGDSVW
jgi:NAD(P)-dependent dehydrogenase (short-subunit alcohol dehydrogenase family)